MMLSGKLKFKESEQLTMNIIIVTIILLNLCASFRYIVKEKIDHSRRKDFKIIDRAPLDSHHQVTVAVKQRNIDILEKILYDVSDMESNNYGKHKTFEEIGQLIENPDATAAIEEWLTSNNIEIIKKSAYGEYLTCSATVEKWEDVLQTTFHLYEKQDSKRSKFIRTTSVSVPDYLHNHIVTILNTVDLPPRLSSSSKLRALPKEVYAIDDATVTFPSAYVTPSVLNKLYSISGNGAGYGSQAVYESLSQTFLKSDLTKFQTVFGLPIDPVDYYIGPIPNSTICNSNSDDCGEASLDVQYILAVGENVPTTYWYDSSSDGSFLTFLTNISNTANPCNIYSISYSAYEVDVGAASISLFNTEAAKLGARGVTLIASSGDDGVTGFAFYQSEPISECGYYAQWPASSPYVTALGGTMNGQPITGTPEIVCASNTGSGITSGGGFSNSIPAPSFQKAAISSYTAQYKAVQSTYQAYNSSNRGYPDVSMAANAYIVVIGGTYYAVDGTSASAPVFAGIVALANAYRLKKGLSALGWINPSIYSNNGGFANDIVSGCNNCTKSSTRCCSIGFQAKPGWDPTTGFGSVNYTKFLSYFGALPSFPTYSPTTIPSSRPTTTRSHSRSPTTKPTGKPSGIPTVSSQSSSPSACPSISKFPSIKPTPIPSSNPTIIPTSIPTYVTSQNPSLSPTSKPTVTSTNAPTAVPSSSSLSSSPSSKVTVSPTSVPSLFPSKKPSFSPSRKPTVTPTNTPTATPSSSSLTSSPSSKVTVSPTSVPSLLSSCSPASKPTVTSTNTPTATPSSSSLSSSPSLKVTVSPTKSPSQTPSFSPTGKPTCTPTYTPTTTPSSSTSTSSPSSKITVSPTCVPSPNPSASSSRRPTQSPTPQPSRSPTYRPVPSTTSYYNFAFTIYQQMASTVNAETFISNTEAVQSFYNVLMTVFSSADLYSATINSAYDYSSSRRRLQSTSAIVVNYTLNYGCESCNVTKYSSMLHANVTNQLNTTIKSGEFNELLANTSSSITQDMQSKVVPTVPTATVEYVAESSSGDSGNSGQSNMALVIGASVGGVFAFILVSSGIAIYLYRRHHGKEENRGLDKQVNIMARNPVLQTANLNAEMRKNNNDDSNIQLSDIYSNHQIIPPRP